LFVLGDAFSVYYTGLGYASITDFDWTQGDKVQLKGSASNYTVSYGTGFADIYYGGDIIGSITNTANFFLNFDVIYV
jgi:hypothetical protein